MHRSTETLWKTVRKDKQKKYQYKVNTRPLSPRNDIILSDNPDDCNISKSDNADEHEASISKTDNNYWPAGSVAIVGDSIGNGINKKRLNINNCCVTVSHFFGARNRDISQIIQPIIKKKPDFLFLHIGTNVATTKDSRKIVDDIFLLKKISYIDVSTQLWSNGV